MEIDPRFKTARQHAAKRRSRNLTVTAAVWSGVGVSVLLLVVGLYATGVIRIASDVADDDADPGIAVADDSGEGPAEQVGSYATSFVDLAGDPMLLRFDQGVGPEKAKPVLRPIELSPARAGNDLILLRDEMITGQERLITTIPSSREDFAFFQAQRQAPAANAKPVLVGVVASGPTDTVVVEEGDESSWGESLPGDAQTSPDTYTASKVENTTSLTYILSEARRAKPYEDVVVRPKAGADLLTQMTLAGVAEPDAKRVSEAVIALMPEAAALGPAHVLALRIALRDGIKMPVQMSLYSGTEYFGSVAVNDLAEWVPAADPWVEEDLFNYAGDDVAADADSSRKYRLLDAFYSAAIRNGVPSAIVAETIVMISQAHDLEAFVNPGDQMILLYSREPGTDGPGPGQVLYASIKGEGRVMECHVFKPAGKEDYVCFGAPGTGGAASSGGVGLRAGLVAPVQGVMTSRFGPRMHPILKVAKLHKGVDWAAPIGTPVMAAFDGTIAAAGDGKGYGNLVRISHPGGLETRYAHLNAFAEGIKPGVAVSAGTLIGYVGTTGQSTGPHLHFELYESGEAVDPLGAGGGTQIASDASAVEKLVDQIIRVESGGNSSAKNPLSSATGLGQFVSGTWLVMMKKYRPDLANTMSKEELLALRTDPTLSREMVTALAREGESYLRSRGHEISAGRLYLCHFLGMEGAHKLLAADDATLAVNILGIGVQNANPTIITNQTAAQVEAWAERKMSGKGGSSLPVAVMVPPEVLAYQKIISTLIDSPT